ncbi:CvpA family protein [Rhizosaccharibacter radicis]|uniref:CvpA family protein n=1 Tax=Rhizosaccharibacter radicis TaxID=2782605 RepID=A0ABT1VTI0_9PROT|nr:CvpA family protein [Acetobacteraceae bacterium KSS12]
MSWVDIAALVVVTLSALLGLLRGFVREALGLAAWIGAALLAVRLYPEALPVANRWIGATGVAEPVTFLAVFAVLLIGFLLIAAAIGGLVRDTVLGGIDRLLGIGFGALRGFAVLVVAFVLGATVLTPADWPQPVRDARLLPFVQQGAAFVLARVPPRYRPPLAASDSTSAGTTGNRVDRSSA